MHEPGPVHLSKYKFCTRCVNLLGSEGRDKMRTKLGTQYYWKGMKTAVERVVRCCIRCQKNRRRKNLPKPPLKPMVYKRLLECVQIDLTFLKEDKGFIGLLTVIDCTSKYLWAFPIRSKRTGPIALKLFRLFNKEGYPIYLQSDNGKEFVSRVMKELTKLLRTHHKRSRPKHPQTNGTVESVNKDLKSRLRETQSNTKCTSWHTVLSTTVAQYNNTPHSSLPGLTPFQRHRMLVPTLDEPRK